MKKHLLLIFLIILMPTTFATGDVKINNFSASVTNGTVPLHVYITGNVTGNVNNWHWKYTNEETRNTTYSSANVTTVHIFAKPGMYNVTLTVWGPNGNDTLTKPAYITVNTPSSNLPIAYFSSNIRSGYAPLSVQFTDISYNATGWNWSFGDGANSTVQNPMHTYSAAGNYTVNLTVSNANGANSKLAIITVIEKTEPVNPVANLSTNVTGDMFLSLPTTLDSHSLIYHASNIWHDCINRAQKSIKHKFLGYIGNCLSFFVLYINV